MKKNSSFVRGIIVMAAICAGLSVQAQTYSCKLEGVGKGKAFVPAWLRAEIEPSWGSVRISDSNMDARGNGAIAAEIARETQERLSLIWKGYAVNAGFNRNPIRPRLRLTINKSTGSARMTSSVPIGAKELRAKGTCVVSR